MPGNDKKYECSIGLPSFDAAIKLYTMSTQFVTDSNGHKLAVILPIKEYNKMIEELEELEDIKLYDKAKQGKQEFIDAELVFKEIEEKRKNKNV